MFSNFIYFLVALIIYATAELFDTGTAPDPAGWVFSLILAAVFFGICRQRFRHIERNAGSMGDAGVDHAVSAAISRLSVLALAVFAANIYLFRLNAGVSRVPLFQAIPTLGALLFLGLFVLYLVVVWNAAFRIQARVFTTEISRGRFVWSHLSFCLPALLPWLCLSLFADLIRFLPHAPARDFLTRPAGEILYMLVFLAGLAVFGPVLIKTLWQCRPMEKSPARIRIEAVCDRAGLRYADILRWDLFAGAMITAGVMGLVGKFRYILVTPALVRALDDAELEAVMLHEIGHVHHHHMLFYLFFFAGFVACNFVLFEPMTLLVLIADPLYRGAAFLGMERQQIHPVMMGVMIIGFFILYFRFGFGFFMRNFERQADLHLYRFFPDPAPLIRTFHKIAAISRQAVDRPNWHHFSIGQRIRFLERCRKDPSLVARHHRRVRRMVTAAVMVLTGVIWVGYSLSYGQLKPGFENFIARQLVFQQLSDQPGDVDLLVFAADFHYARQNFMKAKAAYETAIQADPRHVHALNNLAWLLATCPDDAVRDPGRALELAGRAVSLSREPFVLDTYAEALFVNNRVAEALQAAREALALAGDGDSYYREQIRRFEAGL